MTVVVRVGTALKVHPWRSPRSHIWMSYISTLCFNSEIVLFGRFTKTFVKLNEVRLCSLSTIGELSYSSHSVNICIAGKLVHFIFHIVTDLFWRDNECQ